MWSRAGDHLHDVARDAHEALADDVLRGFATQLGAQVFVRRDVHQPGLRAEGDRRPVLAAPQARAELGGLAGARACCDLVDVGPAGLRIEALEHVLAHVGPASHEVDFPGGALEVPDVAAARDVDQALHRAAVALIIDHDRRRDFVPVPGVVGMVLEVALDLAGVRRRTRRPRWCRDCRRAAGRRTTARRCRCPRTSGWFPDRRCRSPRSRRRRACSGRRLPARSRCRVRLAPAPCRSSTIPCRSRHPTRRRSRARPTRRPRRRGSPCRRRSAARATCSRPSCSHRPSRSRPPCRSWRRARPARNRRTAK